VFFLALWSGKRKKKLSNVFIRRRPVLLKEKSNAERKGKSVLLTLGMGIRGRKMRGFEGLEWPV